MATFEKIAERSAAKGVDTSGVNPAEVRERATEFAGRLLSAKAGIVAPQPAAAPRPGV